MHHARAGELDEARDHLTILIKKHPGRPRVWIEMVKVQAVSGDLTEARAILTDAKALHPQNEALHQLSRDLEP